MEGWEARVRPHSRVSELVGFPHLLRCLQSDLCREGETLSALKERELHHLISETLKGLAKAL